MKFTFALLLTFAGFSMIHNEQFVWGCLTSVVGFAILFRIARKEGNA